MNCRYTCMDNFLLGFTGWPWVGVLDCLAATPTTLASLVAFKAETPDGPAIKKQLAIELYNAFNTDLCLLAAVAS